MISIEEAVDLLYRGRSNLIKAAQASGTTPEELKQALKQKVQETPIETFMEFPWPHYVDEESKTVYAYIESGYPTVMGFGIKVAEHFPGYRGSLCSLNFIEALKRNNP